MKIFPSSQKTISININLIAFLISAALHMCVFAYALNLDIKVPKKQVEQSFKLPLAKFETPINSAKTEKIEETKEPQQPKEEQKKQMTNEVKPKNEIVKKPLPKPKKVEKKQIPKENAKVLNPHIQNQTYEKLPQELALSSNEIDTNQTQSMKSSSLTKNSSENSLKSGENSSNIVYLKSNDELFIKIKNEIIKNVIYPKVAKRLGYQGVVKVEFILDKNGLKSYLLKSESSFNSLNEAAILALKKASLNFPNVDKEYQISLDIAFKIK
ncbi:energy transducer TonB [Campylobacter fetus]|uniref:energy transducer TonB n=1 Tax=Campylobacter fetus TaxID=196 RepID=UPI000A4FB436|nr:energy transducer TonB [Campylobacter fetus]